MKKTNKKSRTSKRRTKANDGLNGSIDIWSRATPVDDRGTFHALQHRGIERVTLDEGGRQRIVTKGIPFWQTKLRELLKTGDVTEAMIYEAVEFKRVYDVSRIDAMRIPDLGKVGGSPGRFPITNRCAWRWRKPSCGASMVSSTASPVRCLSR